MILLKPLKFILFFTGIFFSVNTFAQTITLQMCHDSAEVYFPLVKQKEKLIQINELKLENLNTRYLPSLHLNAKATYQSDVTGIPELPIPGVTMPSAPKDQYAATLDVSQLIFDGGAIKAAKNITGLNNQVELQKIEVDIYKIKEQINQLYLNTLLIQENTKILKLTKATVLEQKKILESAVDNGIVNISELDDLDAELLKLEQQLIELSAKKTQLTEAISLLSGINMPENYSLEIPSAGSSKTYNPHRPEHVLFENQAKVLDASIDLTGKKRMPVMAAFGSLGYGNPGLNMFNEEWDSYYMAGAQLKWNIWDWKKTSREKQQLTLQKQLITDHMDAFNRNLAVSTSEAEIREQKLTRLLEKDKEIITLRKKISKRTASQLENGIKTSADYIRDLNAEKQALINLKTREIQIIQAQIDRLSLAGKPLFTD